MKLTETPAGGQSHAVIFDFKNGWSVSIGKLRNGVTSVITYPTLWTAGYADDIEDVKDDQIIKFVNKVRKRPQCLAKNNNVPTI